MNILHIEDCLTYRKFIKCLFSGFIDSGVSIKSFKSIDSVYDEENIDIILLDLNLESSNGVNTVEGVKKRWPDVPIVALTASDDVLDHRICLDSGVDSIHLKKQTTITGLLHSMKVAIVFKDNVSSGIDCLYDKIVELETLLS